MTSTKDIMACLKKSATSSALVKNITGQNMTSSVAAKKELIATGQRRPSAVGKVLGTRRSCAQARESAGDEEISLPAANAKLRREGLSNESKTLLNPESLPKPTLARMMSRPQLVKKKSVKEMRLERQGSSLSMKAEQRRRAGLLRRSGAAADEDAKKAAEEAAKAKPSTTYRKGGPFPEHRETLLHIALTISFSAVMLGSRSYEYAHAFGLSLNQQLAGTELPQYDTPVAKPLYEVQAVDEIYSYLRGVLTPGVLDPDVSPRSFDGWVNGQNRMIGAMRLKQIRVATNSCRPDPLLARLSNFSIRPACYASISKSTMRTAPIYGVNLDNNGTRRVYQHSAEGDAFWKLNTRYGFALLRNYPTSGYVVDIPAQRIYADAAFEQLQRDDWLNLETRSVSVQFTLANANINMLCAVRIVFERLESGGVFAYFALRPFRPSRYEGADAQGRRAADVFSIIFVCYFMLQEFWEMRRAVAMDKDGLLAYFKLPSNLFDWASLGVFWAVLGCRSQMAAQLERLERETAYDPMIYYEVDTVADISAVENNLMAVLAIMVYFKIFKFVTTFSQVDTIAQTLKNAGENLVLFLVLFLLIMTAYSLAFYLAFGNDVYAYRGVSDSFIALFRLLLGDLDVQPLLHANPWLFVLLSLSFTLTVYLCLINMFLAILSDNYLRARTEKDGKDQTLALLTEFLLVKTQKAVGVLVSAKKTAEKVVGFLANYGSKEQARAKVNEQMKKARAKMKEQSRMIQRQASGIFGGARFAASADKTEEEEEEEDPSTWEEQMIELLAPEEAAVMRTASATEKLKELYLKVVDGQQETMDLIERVALAVRAQQHENAMILNGLEARGVTFSLESASFHRTDVAETPSPGKRSAKKKKMKKHKSSEGEDGPEEGPSPEDDFWDEGDGGPDESGT